mgnify:FL=1
MIETISVDQLHLIAPLWDKLNALHKDLDGVCGKPRRDTTWEERCSQLYEKGKGKSLIQIALVESSPVGYCFTSIDDANKGEIDSLFVLMECRGKGFGKKLMENALNWLSDSHCDDIQIWVHPGNTNAISFYWNFGFATGPAMKKVANKPL